MPSFIRADIWQNTLGIPYNAVLQVQHFSFPGSFTTTTHGGGIGGPSASGTDTPLTVSITPRFSNSRILVRATGEAGFHAGQQVWLGSIRRTGPGTAFSPASTPGSMIGWSQSIYWNVAGMSTFNIEWYDTPGSTVPCNYTLKISGNNNNSNGVGIGIADISSYTTWGGINTITAMEIAQ